MRRYRILKEEALGYTKKKKKEDVNCYWMTLRKREDTGFCRKNE
jgi:hypothetical protein